MIQLLLSSNMFHHHVLVIVLLLIRRLNFAGTVIAVAVAVAVTAEIDGTFHKTFQQYKNSHQKDSEKQQEKTSPAHQLLWKSDSSSSSSSNSSSNHHNVQWIWASSSSSSSSSSSLSSSSASSSSSVHRQPNTWMQFRKNITVSLPSSRCDCCYMCNGNNCSSSTTKNDQTSATTITNKTQFQEGEQQLQQQRKQQQYYAEYDIILDAKIAVDSKYWLWAIWDDNNSNNNDNIDNNKNVNSNNNTKTTSPTHGCRQKNTKNNHCPSCSYCTPPHHPLLLVREGGLKRGPTPHDTWYDKIHVSLLSSSSSSSSSSCHDNIDNIDIANIRDDHCCHHHQKQRQQQQHQQNRTITIGVLVWYFGKSGFSHNDSGQGGLIIDGTIIMDSINNRNNNGNGNDNDNTTNDNNHNNEKQIILSRIVTDSSWQVRQHPAFQSRSTSSSSSSQLPYTDHDNDNDPRPNYRLSEQNIFYDARKNNVHDHGESWWDVWSFVHYDRHHHHHHHHRSSSSSYYNSLEWKDAMELGPPGTAPWNQLWLRSIPQWKDTSLQEYHNIQYFYKEEETINNKKIYQQPRSSAQQVLIIQARLPYNVQFTPYIEFVGQQQIDDGIRVDIQTDNYQRHHSFDGKGDTYLRATYITKASSGQSTRQGRQQQQRQSFESPSWINGHVVTYRISNFSTNTNSISNSSNSNDNNNFHTNIKVMYRETSYNAATRGSFNCNDQFYNTLWMKALRTLQVNMRDNFMDCPDRERAQWWGDTTVDIGQVMYALDRPAHTLIRKAILDLVYWQKHYNTSSCTKQQQQQQQQYKALYMSNDVETPSPSAAAAAATSTTTVQCQQLHSPVPGNHHAELPVQMLASIGWYGFYNYYLCTGDSQTIQIAYPHVRSYLQTCWSMNTTTGLINHRHGDWDWEDWGKNYDSHILDNAWYVLALKAAIPMANLTGYTQDISLWREQIASIQNNFDREFWTGDAYCSPEHRAANKPPDDRSNAMAVLAGFVSPRSKERTSKIVQVLRKQFWASPYMEKYVLEALYKMGYADEALRRMKNRYWDMVESPNITTLWEQWDLGGSGTYNHAWSGGGLTLLSQHSAGVAPISPGWRTYHVLPEDGEILTSIIASVPAFVNGKDVHIIVKIRKYARRYTLKSECAYQLELVSPAGTEAIVGIPRAVKFPGMKCQLHSLRIGDVLAWKKQQLLDETKFPEGVSFYEEAEDYVKWKIIECGKWLFEGSAGCQPEQANAAM